MRQTFSCAVFLLAAVATSVAAEVTGVVTALDEMRLPGRSFAVRVNIAAEVRLGKAAEAWAFDLFARRTAESAGATFDVVLHSLEPAADRGKRILFTRQGCWLHDPKAKRPVKVPAQQLWSQGSVTDMLTWSLARDFVATDGGLETLTLEGGTTPVTCHRYDFIPRPGAAFASGPMRYWLDAKGAPLQAVHLTAIGKPWRTVRFVEFQEVLGTRRPVTFGTWSRSQVCRITLSAHRAVKLPPAATDPETFGTATLP